MNEKIRKYFEELFNEAPYTKKALDLKEEMISNANDKYQDLMAQGFSEEDAFRNVISSIGDVKSLFRELEEETEFSKSEENRKKRAVTTAIAVGLYIFAGVVFFAFVLFGDIMRTNYDLSLLRLIIAVFICIIPTCMLVYVANMYPSYVKKDETMAEIYRGRISSDKREKEIFGAISAIIWTLVVVAYFVISFTTMAWHISWVIFLIGGCLEAVVKLVMSIRREDE